MTSSMGRVALLWRGDHETRVKATSQNNRLNRIFASLAAQDIDAVPVVYHEEVEDEVRAQLLDCKGVLVWVDPLSEGKTRARLDPLLREIASYGIWVSAHPDTILKMGTKEVLYRTKSVGWGTDTFLYRNREEFRRGFPSHLVLGIPRVLKRNRGNGGQGVWKVERLDYDKVRVLEARRGSVPEVQILEDFLARCEVYLEEDGLIVDQPFQPRLPEGMIRCYMGMDRVVGFGHQHIKALIPPPPERPDSPETQPGPRIMHSATAPRFQRLRCLMEGQWIPQMMDAVALTQDALPIVWDADFLYGPKTPEGEDSYVLCEINVSSVFPIPDEAPDAIARLVRARLNSGDDRR